MVVLENEKALKPGSNCMQFDYFVKRRNGRGGCVSGRIDAMLLCSGREPQILYTETHAREQNKWIQVVSEIQNVGNCKVRFSKQKSENECLVRTMTRTIRPKL